MGVTCSLVGGGDVVVSSTQSPSCTREAGGAIVTTASTECLNQDEMGIAASTTTQETSSNTGVAAAATMNPLNCHQHSSSSCSRFPQSLPDDDFTVPKVPALMSSDINGSCDHNPLHDNGDQTQASEEEAVCNRQVPTSTPKTNFVFNGPTLKTSGSYQKLRRRQKAGAAQSKTSTEWASVLALPPHASSDHHLKRIPSGSGMLCTSLDGFPLSFVNLMQSGSGSSAAGGAMRTTSSCCITSPHPNQGGGSSSTTGCGGGGGLLPSLTLLSPTITSTQGSSENRTNSIQHQQQQGGGGGGQLPPLSPPHPVRRAVSFLIEDDQNHHYQIDADEGDAFA